MAGKGIRLIDANWARLYSHFQFLDAPVEVHQQHVDIKPGFTRLNLIRQRFHPLHMYCRLLVSEKSVGELAEAIGARDTAVSQQLAVLRRERIVKARRDGQTMFYRIVRSGVGDLLDHLYAAYCGDTAYSEETTK